jgi:hypothetical protein
MWGQQNKIGKLTSVIGSGMWYLGSEHSTRTKESAKISPFCWSTHWDLPSFSQVATSTLRSLTQFLVVSFYHSDLLTFAGGLQNWLANLPNPHEYKPGPLHIVHLSSSWGSGRGPKGTSPEWHASGEVTNHVQMQRNMAPPLERLVVWPIWERLGHVTQWSCQCGRAIVTVANPVVI